MSCDQRNPVMTGDFLNESQIVSMRLLPNILYAGANAAVSMHNPYCSRVGEGDVPDAPNLRPRDFDAARKRHKFLHPSPPNLVGVCDSGVDKLVAYDGVRFRADFIPVLFDDCSRCGITRWPRPSRGRTCIQ